MLKIRPIVVNNDMIVLGGNMRLKPVKLWVKEIPIIKASDLTEEQGSLLLKITLDLVNGWQRIANGNGMWNN